TKKGADAALPNGRPNRVKALQRRALRRAAWPIAHAAGKDRAASERPVLFGERTMKTVLFAACLTLVAAEAQAISRYDPSR
ncbi:MAG: hypothetical protein E5X57_36455, partial [Mesorhizobium sp.]